MIRNSSLWPVALLWATWAQAAPVEPPERMSWLDNGTIRIGVDLDRGGAITYLADAKQGTNLINSFDLGRQIQMSFYSGPVPFTPQGKQPPDHWRHIGWNPIQTGDCFGHPSRVVEQSNDGRELHVKCVPMQWSLDDEPGECTFDCWITLDGAVARVRSRLDNRRADKTQYAARYQELPAVYTNGPLYRLFTYSGDRPFTDGELRRIVKRPGEPGPWSRWMATENWSALVGDDDRGVGVWQRDCFEFHGGFAGQPGKGGPHDDPTGYVTPVQLEIIDHDIRYEYHYELIVGSLTEIRRHVYAQGRQPLPPDWRFDRERLHWHLTNATDAGWRLAGHWAIQLEKPDPYLVSPSWFWQAAERPRLVIEAACRPGLAGPAQVFWRTVAEPNSSESRALSFRLPADGEFHTTVVDLSTAPTYRGGITGLRIDPTPEGHPGDWIQIHRIALLGPAEAGKLENSPASDQKSKLDD
jgi:hypothetical protein